jgi:hypothetical protein
MGDRAWGRPNFVTGGAVTTALVSDSDDHGDHHRIGQKVGPGMPMMIPPGGRQRFPGDESEDGTEGDTDGGADDESSLSQS